jgi:mannose-6-phosphate isomerase
LNNPCEADGLRALFTTWITAPQSTLEVLVRAVLSSAVRYLCSGATEFMAEAETVLELGQRYPGDAGVLAALLLNRITLAPGEALFLPAGNLHAYLRGTAIEVMANSDNVLRGGLTPKHVDVRELLRVLDFTPVREDFLRPHMHRDGPELVYRTTAEEFAVSVLEFDGKYLGHEVETSPHQGGPQILLCSRGFATLRGKSRALTLRRGTAAWVSAADSPIRVVAQCPAQLISAAVGP